MTGSVRVSRGLFDDEAFKAEPFSEREAFLWLIMEASFKTREKRVGNVVVSLRRGQLAASIRFMQEAWGWQSTARVFRYLDRLKNRNMIETLTETGVTVITVCKYDIYQSANGASETPAATPPKQQRNTGETNENKDEIREVGSNEPTARKRAVSAAQHLEPIIGSELAGAFVAHRVALKAPMTPHAGKLMAAKLAAMPDPAAAVTLSLERGWKGVFEPEPAKVHQFPSKRQNDAERFDDLVADLKARVAVQRLE